MSDSDDDLPPPLEDMSAQVTAMQARKQQQEKAGQGASKTSQATAAAQSTAYEEDDEGWSRIAPKKQPAAQASAQAASQAKPAAKPLIQEVTPSATAPQPVAAAAKPKKASGGFGGFKAGFLLGGSSKPKRKPAAAAQPKPAPVIEDHTYVKAQDPSQNLRFESVQNNLKTGLENSKNEWLTPQFLEKIMASPRLSKAFTNPEQMKILTEMGSKPQETMQKYGNNPEFKEMLLEFSALCGGHFEGIAQKKQAEEEKKMQDDPVMKTIQGDPEVKAILEDPKVMKVITQLQQGGGLDFHEVLRRDPVTGNKLYTLIQKGVLNTQTTPPNGGQLP